MRKCIKLIGLLTTLLLIFFCNSVFAQEWHDNHLMLTPEELEWGPIASMGEGASIAFIEGDLSKEEPFTFRLTLEPGYIIKPHIHPEYERVTVLEGTLYFAHGKEYNPEETRKLPVGGLAIMPPGEPMFGHVEERTVIQLHGNGPWGIEYINPEDDPRLADADN
ncbi:MAG: cupin domain-containing protein [Balneolaceae bacterium]|nr:cupin domain-containing protein [Balneolaceae bacterium]